MDGWLFRMVVDIVELLNAGFPLGDLKAVRPDIRT